MACPDLCRFALECPGCPLPGRTLGSMGTSGGRQPRRGDPGRRPQLESRRGTGGFDLRDADGSTQGSDPVDIWRHHTQFKTEISKVSPYVRATTESQQCDEQHNTFCHSHAEVLHLFPLGQQRQARSCRRRNGVTPAKAGVVDGLPMPVGNPGGVCEMCSFATSPIERVTRTVAVAIISAKIASCRYLLLRTGPSYVASEEECTLRRTGTWAC